MQSVKQGAVMKKLYLLASILLLLLSLIILQSCQPASPPPEEEDMILNLHLNPAVLDITAGGTGEVEVTVERIGFEGDVTLSWISPPTWLNPSFDPRTVPSGSNTSTLTITLDATAITGQDDYIVRGETSSITGWGYLNLTVIQAQQDFSLSLLQDTISIEQGQSNSVYVNITRFSGFSEPVTLSLEGTPSGITPVFDPNPSTGNTGSHISVLTLSVDTSVTPGNYNLTIKGTANTSEKTVPITLIVTKAPQQIWEIRTEGVLPNLYGLHFINDNLGWVVGDQGAIYKIGNSGYSLSQQDGRSDQSFYDVHFTDASTGVAVGTAGTIRRTTNGGATWDTLPSPAAWNLNGVFFINENRGWVVSHYGIYRTTDAGENWETQYETNGFYDSYNSVYFTSADFGIVVGYNQNLGGSGTILRTTNGGLNWAIPPSGTTWELTDAYFIGANTWAVVGLGGRILRSTDGGINWDNQTTGTSNDLKGVAFTDTDNGWAIGSTVILRTTNGGTNWEEDLYNQFYLLEDIFLVGSNIKYVVGQNGIILRRSD